MKEEERKILELLKPQIEALGYEVVEVALNGGKNKTLSVVVDRVTPISLEDIVQVSQEVSAVLDQHDPIDGAYTLDVSSLGAEKPIPVERLKDYEGRYVALHLSHPYKGENLLEGTLVACLEETLSLRIKDKAARKTIEIPTKDVDKARLAIEF